MATILTSYSTYKSEDVKAALESAREQYKTECLNEEHASDPECNDLDQILTDERLSRYLPPGTRVGTIATVNDTGYYPLSVVNKGMNETIVLPDGRHYTRSLSDEQRIPRITTKSAPSCLSETKDCSTEDALFANILSAATYVDFRQTEFLNPDDVFKFSSAVRHAAYWLQSHDSEIQPRFFLHEN